MLGRMNSVVLQPWSDFAYMERIGEPHISERNVNTIHEPEIRLPPLVQTIQSFRADSVLEPVSYLIYSSSQLKFSVSTWLHSLYYAFNLWEINL